MTAAEEGARTAASAFLQRMDTSTHKGIRVLIEAYSHQRFAERGVAGALNQDALGIGPFVVEK